MATAEEIKARMAGNSVSWMDSDTPAVVQPEVATEETDDDYSAVEEASVAGGESTEDSVQVAIDAIDKAREVLDARWKIMKTETLGLTDQVSEVLEKGEVALSEFVSAQATFYHHLKNELPLAMQAIAQGILEGELDLIARDITNNTQLQIEEKFTPLMKKVETAITNLNSAATNVEVKTGGVKPYLKQIGVAVSVAVILFLGLNLYSRLGADAEYGRKAKAVIQTLDPASRTALEKLISK